MTAPDAAERLRREALRRLQILDTPPEPDFDALARLAAHVCGAPIALLTLLDGDRQWFKAHIGLEATETPREQAFCDHAVARGGLMVVPDARSDARFARNPLVTGEPHVRFYAGAPLVTEEGVGLGTLCVADHVPRTLSPEQGEALRMLARQAVAQMELRAHVRQVAALQAEQLAEAERTARTQAALTELARLDKTELDGALRAITRVAARTLGVERVGVWLFEAGGEELVCAALYRLSAGAHDAGMRIRAADAPAYFAALRESPTLAADDALADPRTREFTDGYLRPLGIGAMLDVPVWREGRVAGVLCHEHVGGPRAWNHEEQDLAAGAAAIAAVALEAAERRRSEAEARRTAGRMRAVAGAAAGVVGAHSLERLRRVVHDACSLVVPFDDFTFTVREHALRRAPRMAIQLSGMPIAPAPAVHADAAAKEDAAGEADPAGDSAPRGAPAGPDPAPGVERDPAAKAGAGGDAEGDADGTGSAIEAPIVGSGGRVLGMLGLRSGAAGLYGPADADVVRAVASLAAVALEGLRTDAERQRAEEALRVSEESYRTIFELASDAMFVHHPESGAVLDANRRACELHGCSLERLKEIGIPGISDGGPEFDGATARARVRAAAAGEPQRFEWRVRDAAGEPAWVEVSLHAVSIRGEPRVLASVRDIGQRKAAEEALRRLNDELEQRVDERTAELAQANLALEEEIAERTAAEEELRAKTSELEAVFRALPDLYFRFGADGTLLDHEASTRDPLFVPCADCRGKPVGEVFPPALARAFAEGMAELARTGELVCIEDVLPGAAGDRHFEARLLPFLDGQTIVVVRDITDRARAERALQAREEHYRRIIENSSDVATILDASGVNVYQSPSVERVLGYRADEMLGTSAFGRIHPGDHERARQTLGEVVRNPGRSASAELRYRHADGSWRWVDAIARTFLPDSADAGVIVNVRDVTERRQAQDALRRAIEEAEKAREAAENANRAKSEFLSRMSHELRTPMNSILGFAQLLARRGPTEEQRRHVEQILRAGRHLLNLINEVLDIARIESNRQTLSLEPVAVHRAVAEALSLIRPLAAEHDCRLQVPETAPGLHVCADRQRLTQVLLNLASNAVKYNRRGGSVRVGVRAVPAAEGTAGPGTVRISVHDTGRGIAPELMAELFVPFARLGAEGSGVEGTGLGLALSQRLAEAMGGSLTAESVPGEGSTFTLELPAAADPLERLPSRPAQGSASSAPAEAAPAGRKATLLYIEDNLANLALVETLLASSGEFTLLTAMQGRMGLYLAWEQAPDLILLDLHLPDLPGDEVLRQLRADPRTAGTRVVVISADATPGRMERLRAAGADGYLAKPLELDEFLGTIDRMLEEDGAPDSG